MTSGHLARLPKADKLNLYRIMYTGRKLDEKIRWIIKRSGTGFIPTVALIGLGEEAVAGGASFALDPKIDWIFPGHRCKTALVQFGLTPLEDLSNHGCKAESPMGGRDGNVHYAFIHRHIGKFISHMGAGAAAACGVVDGLRYLYEIEDKTNEKLPVAMVFFGDGAAQQGIIHEAMNYAGTRNLPVIFVIDNNHIATVTHYDEQTAAKHLFLRSLGYNIGWEYVKNGNDVVSVYNAAKLLVDRARILAQNGPYKGESRAPAILECDTFRWAGHNETIKISDVDAYEFAEWVAQDPILLYRNFLLRLQDPQAIAAIADREPMKMLECSIKEFSEEDINAIEKAADAEIEDAWEKVQKLSEPDPKKENMYEIWPANGFFVKAERRVEPFNAGLRTSFKPEELKNKITLGQALQEVIRETLATNPKARLFGEDVAGHERQKGGVYGMTLPALKDKSIREEQIFDTPLSEIAIIGSAIGQSLVGITPIAEIQYFPFLSVALSQLIDYAATHYYTTKVWIKFILRLPYGMGTAGGHFHSSSILESLLYHVPGIKMVDPSTPQDAIGLFRQALKEKCPVMFKENLWGLSRIWGTSASEDYIVPIGLPALRQEGKDLTIITWGAKIIYDTILPAVERLKAENHSIEIIELRSLRPYGLEFLVDSVRRTHRCLIVHEDIESGGIGQSVGQELEEAVFFDLLAPVKVYGGHFTPSPQHPILEAHYLPSKEGVIEKAKQLLAYK